MMQLKLFEVRDRATFIPCFAFLTTCHPLQSSDAFLLKRAGFDPALPHVIFGKLEHPDESRYDPYSWGPSRTMRAAHEYVARNWFSLASGDVVDVEYVLGETKAPKESERLT